MEWLNEWSAEENQWARTVVSVFVGAVLGAGASLLVQARSNRAAMMRQRQAELAKHCDDLIQLMTTAKPPKSGTRIDGTKYRYIPVEGWDRQFRQVTNRLLMWLPRPGFIRWVPLPKRFRWVKATPESVFKDIGETLRDDYMIRPEEDPYFFTRGEGRPFTMTVYEASNKYRESLVECLIELPANKPIHMYKDLSAARSRYLTTASTAWQECEPLLYSHKNAWGPSDELLDLADEVEEAG